MRTTRILLAALSLAVVAACTAEPTAVVPGKNPAFDGAGFNGSGNAVASDTTSTIPERGAGFNGSGN